MIIFTKKYQLIYRYQTTNSLNCLPPSRRFNFIKQLVSLIILKIFRTWPNTGNSGNLKLSVNLNKVVMIYVDDKIKLFYLDVIR